MGCHQELTEQDVKNVCGNKNPLVSDFNQIRLRQLATKFPQRYKHCPTVDCTKIYEINPDAVPTKFTCELCKIIYCSHCQLKHELMMSREEHDKFVNFIEQNGQEQAEWIAENAQKCPSCKERINKDDGCKYVKCGFCKILFCWQCLKTFGKLGPHAVVPHECK
jgi:hypothetical protein